MEHWLLLVLQKMNLSVKGKSGISNNRILSLLEERRVFVWPGISASVCLFFNSELFLSSSCKSQQSKTCTSHHLRLVDYFFSLKMLVPSLGTPQEIIDSRLIRSWLHLKNLLGAPDPPWYMCIYRTAPANYHPPLVNTSNSDPDYVPNENDDDDNAIGDTITINNLTDTVISHENEPQQFPAAEEGMEGGQRGPQSHNIDSAGIRPMTRDDENIPPADIGQSLTQRLSVPTPSRTGRRLAAREEWIREVQGSEERHQALMNCIHYWPEWRDGFTEVVQDLDRIVMADDQDSEDIFGATSWSQVRDELDALQADPLLAVEDFADRIAYLERQKVRYTSYRWRTGADLVEDAIYVAWTDLEWVADRLEEVVDTFEEAYYAASETTRTYEQAFREQQILNDEKGIFPRHQSATCATLRKAANQITVFIQHVDGLVTKMFWLCALAEQDGMSTSWDDVMINVKWYVDWWDTQSARWKEWRQLSRTIDMLEVPECFQGDRRGDRTDEEKEDQKE